MVATVLAVPAAAQEIVLTGPLAGAPATSGYSVTPGAKGSERIILPSGYMELGGEMALVMSEASNGGGDEVTETLRLTDVGLLRLRMRRSFADWLELYGATSLLAKQPHGWDEPVWQGAGGGARIACAKHFAAHIGARGGPLFKARLPDFSTDPSGRWWTAATDLEAKAAISYLLRFDLGIGLATTVLEPTTSSSDVWLQEATGHGEAQVGTDEGAFWVRFDYAAPVDSGGAAQSFDPSVRLGVEVGGVLTVSEAGWDVFAAYSFIDRGELDRPETMLPILDGGFDQTQVLAGVAHRFRGKPRASGRRRE